MNLPFQNDRRAGGRKLWARLLCLMCVSVLFLTACTDGAVDTTDGTAAELEALKASIQYIEQEISSLKDTNQTALEEIASLKGQIADMQQELADLEASEVTAAEIEALKASIQVAQQQVDTLNATVAVNQGKIEELTASNTAAQQKIDELTASNSAAQQEINALKTSYQAALEEIEALKAQIKELQGSNSGGDEGNGGNSGDDTGKIRIYIDQGHNPTDNHNSGAINETLGLYEENITYAIGILLAQLLEEDGRFVVQLSRPTEDTVLGTDNNSALAARVQGAEDFKADYFISLHTNSYSDASVNGIEVYYVSGATTAKAFGTSLLSSLVAATGMKNRGMKTETYYVIKYTSMPAVLVEMGFISNTSDATKMSEQPELFAQGLYDGILAYFELT